MISNTGILDQSKDILVSAYGAKIDQIEQSFIFFPLETSRNTCITQTYKRLKDSRTLKIKIK